MTVPSTLDFVNETNTLINLVTSQFVSRTQIESNGDSRFRGATLTPSFKDQALWFTLSTTDGEAHSITIPIPFVKDGIVFIKVNGIRRALCDHFLVQSDKRIPYLSIIQNIFLSDFSLFVETVFSKKTVFIQQLAYSVVNGNSSIVVYSIQKAINEIVNKMPLHETDMNSFMMNHRLLLIDPAFEEFSDPKERLQYQVKKNLAYFDRGWTSIGLSDGTLADKNYIVSHDMRCYTPFGLNHHNPQRNLYSTLGMKGDELPNIRSKSMQILMDTGIKRTGWNLMTAFVDIPDTFEDQIVVDNSLKELFTTKERRIQCFGNIVVKPGQQLKYGQTLAITDDGKSENFMVFADNAWVQDIKKTIVSVGGISKKVYDVTIIIKRNFKDGTKLTNSHGNKGVIRFKELGHAIDENTGEKIKLQLLVSAKTIGKRKNYGQLLEMFYNNIRDFDNAAKGSLTTTTSTKMSSQGLAAFPAIKVVAPKVAPVIVDDEHIVTKEELANLEARHREMGFLPECVRTCETYAGTFTAVCGKVFWGVIKDPEDQLWSDGATVVTNGKDLRTAGLKFSTVEFKALDTIFGKDNSVTEEVLSYAQGTGLIQDAIEIINSKQGIIPSKATVISPLNIKTVDQSGGTLFSEKAIEGTFADEFQYTDGCVLQLPVQFQTALPIKDYDPIYEGMAVYTEETLDREQFRVLHTTDKLVVPGSVLRRSWKHSSGLFGMSELATLLNNIALFCKRHATEPEEPRHLNMLYKTIQGYYGAVARMLSTKKGLISTQALSVRYPYSAKAVATLSNELPMNTVEIHTSMAKTIGVKTGDCVMVERFPCLGFMGIRVQKVAVTSDPMCRFTIRASKQSLVSTNLDFDGDVIYIAAFHTTAAKAALLEQFENPAKSYWVHIDKLNNRKGGPFLHTMNLKDYNINAFPKFTPESHGAVVGKLTGVKAQTGPVIAMTYNIMRIMENSGVEIDQAMRADIEMFTEKVGQSVFEQKHGGQSLHDIVIDAICTADIKALVTEGFEETTVKLICGIITKKAAAMNINDLVYYHKTSSSNIVNKIVRAENNLYFVSRSFLEGCRILEQLDSPVVDLPSRIFKRTTSNEFTNVKTLLDVEFENKLLRKIEKEEHLTYKSLFCGIDKLFGIKLKPCEIELGSKTSFGIPFTNTKTALAA